MRRATVLLNALFVLSALIGIAPAQVAIGTLPFNSYDGGPFDSVNLGNLNVHLDINLIGKRGRGLPFNYDLAYDNSVWSPVSVSGHQTWQPSSAWGWHSATLATASPYVAYSQTITSGHCGPMGQSSYQETSYGGFVYHDQWGGQHPFNLSAAYFNSPGGASCPPNGPQPTNSQTANAPDGSHYTLTIGIPGSTSIGGTLVNCNGMTLTVPWLNTPPTRSNSFSAVDANGNTISYNGTNGQFTDTLGQTVLTVAAGNPVTYTYTAPSGAAAVWHVTYAPYNVKTHFNCSGVSEYSLNNVELVYSISRPDGATYLFSYEPTPGFAGYVTGRLASITLPTGGTITYQYTGGSNGIVCADGSTAGLNRTLNPGGTWTYSRTQVSGNHWQTIVASPPDSQNAGSANDETVIDFQKDSAVGYGATYGFFETQRQSFQGTHIGGTLLLKTITCWNGNTNNSTCTTTAVSSRIVQRTSWLQYPNGLQSETNAVFNSCGLPSETDQYAFGSGSPGNLLQKTSTIYAALGNNIADHPSSVTVTDGNAKILSKTSYTYDEYALQPTSGTPQHASISGSRGNATTISRTVIGSTVLTQHFSYNDTGNVYQSTDVNGAVTTYNYADVNSTCGNSFPSSVILAVGNMSSSTSWNCVGGVAISVTDLNGNTNSTTYSDPYFWRPASTADPLSNQTTFAYYNPNASEAYMIFNGGQSIADSLTTIDGLGRATVSQRQQSPTCCTFDTIETDYDLFGRPSRHTVPYVSTSFGQTNASASSIMTTYDALNRPLQIQDAGGGWVKFTYNQNDVLQEIGPAPTGENSKKKQLEYDALGRLISVCEITNLPVSAPCGQTSGSYNGYYTTYSYGVNASGYPTLTVTQGAPGSQQLRVYTYDLIGRLVSEQNPESSTATYTYDSDGSGICAGTYSGDLVKQVDARGNNTCYKYDALHRMTRVTYASGPDVTNSAMKMFYYDAPYSNPNTVNTKGKLASAGTCQNPTCAGPWFTLEDFSYSARGEVTDVYERTPNSNGTYHTSASYWGNGALNQLSGIPSVPATIYGWYGGAGPGLDGEGRTTRVAVSGPYADLIPYQGVTYNTTNSSQPIGAITQVNYGSGDSDGFSYDSNTGRLTQYTFNMNGNTDTTQTSWNQNGSLASFQITDNISGTLDTQNCSYTHDDLARVASVNCVNGSTNIWNQQFTYDMFGNITKNSNGPGSVFQPTYASSSNWITALPGCSPTYDSNGRMTYDCNHSYYWDADGNMIGVDSTTMTYDALGRMVEKNAVGGYTQILYSPIGRVATLSGQMLQHAFIPLPGDGTAVYDSSGIAYYRHSDQLGSSRLASTQSRTLYSSTAYAPFGEPYTPTGTTDLSFTGIDQDTTSGIYDFLFRKYLPVQGRWISPDPAGLGAVDMATPQSWNRYAYVLNNPLAMLDPLGLDPCNFGGAEIPNLVNMTFDCNNSGTPSYYEASYGGPPPALGPGCWTAWCPGASGGVVWNEPIATNAELNAGETYYLAGVPWYKVDNGHLIETFRVWTYWDSEIGAGYMADVKIDQSVAAANNDSWAWNFTKAFVGGLGSSAGWKAVYQSFGEGGCDQLMFETFAEGINPLPGGGPDAGTALEVGPRAIVGAGKAAASAYSVYRGLSVPLRSSIYRGLQSSTYSAGAAFEEAAPYALVGYAGGKALITAGSAAYNGECH